MPQWRSNETNITAIRPLNHFSASVSSFRFVLQPLSHTPAGKRVDDARKRAEGPDDATAPALFPGHRGRR